MKTAAVAIKSWFLAIRDKLTAIQADPWPICMGYAFGVFLATTPFIGLKVLIAIPICYLFRWSKISAIIGVLHVNIITGPVFYGFAFMIGRIIVGTQLDFNPAELLSFHGFLEMVTGSLGVFLSLLAGGAVIGIPSSVAAYFLASAIVRKKAPSSMTVVRRAYEVPVFTLITGASCGLGKELAIECARRGRNLLLVALPGRNLDLLCRQLEKEFGILAHAFETDLTEKYAVQELAGKVL